MTVLVGRCPHFSHAESWNLQVDEWLKDFSLKEREEYSNVKALNANDVRKAVRSVSLFAHYLVHKALAQVGVDLNSVAYSRNDFGRPLYIGGVPLDASISHEQDCAAVAALRACSEHARVGIDLVNTSDKSFRQLEPFRELFRGEWDTIEQSPSRLPIFWAIKEAKSKALGNGLFADTAKTRAILLDTSLDLKGRQSVVVSVVDYLLERRGDLAPVAVKVSSLTNQFDVILEFS